jgi:chromosome segregation ATPase
MENEEKILKILESMQTDIGGLKQSQELICTQLREHGAILSALQTASEFHKADIDNLTHAVARLEGQLTKYNKKQEGIESDIKEIKEEDKSIREVIGDHEISIRTLQRRVV